jgi:rare lipoprotein A (RlpA)-like double-psi beta-barrel protein
MIHRASKKARVVLSAAVVGMAVAAAAPAGAASSDRAQAAAVMRSLDRLSAQRAALTVRLDAARARLSDLSSRLAEARLREGLDRDNLAASRRLLAQALVSQYKTGGADPALLVFSAGSFSDLVERIDMLNRLGSTEVQTMAAIVAGDARLRVDAAVTERRRAAVSAQVAALDRARGSLDEAIAARRRLLDSITARIRSRIAAEQRRRAQLAQRTAADTPSGGGPTTGSSGGANGFSGDVTWYGPGFAGQPTASGEIFDPSKLTAASPWLPFQTMVRVTSTVTGKSVVVRVNDRGPFGHGVLDLAAHAARLIGLSGWQRCRIVILSEP